MTDETDEEKEREREIERAEKPNVFPTEKEKEREQRSRMHSIESLFRSHLSVGSEIPSTLLPPIDRVQQARLLEDDNTNNNIRSQNVFKWVNLRV